MIRVTTTESSISRCYKSGFYPLYLTLTHRYNTIDAETVRDSIQEAFVRAYEREMDWDQPRLFKWIETTATRVLIDTLRQNQRWFETANDEDIGEIDFEHQLDDGMDFQLCIKRIDEQEGQLNREIFLMMLHGYNNKEIGEQKHLSQMSVAQRISRMKKRINHWYRYSQKNSVFYAIAG